MIHKIYPSKEIQVFFDAPGSAYVFRNRYEGCSGKEYVLPISVGLSPKPYFIVYRNNVRSDEVLYSGTDEERAEEVRCHHSESILKKSDVPILECDTFWVKYHNEQYKILPRTFGRESYPDACLAFIPNPEMFKQNKRVRVNKARVKILDVFPRRACEYGLLSGAFYMIALLKPKGTLSFSGFHEGEQEINFYSCCKLTDGGLTFEHCFWSQELESYLYP